MIEFGMSFVVYMCLGEGDLLGVLWRTRVEFNIVCVGE